MHQYPTDLESPRSNGMFYTDCFSACLTQQQAALTQAAAQIDCMALL